MVKDDEGRLECEVSRDIYVYVCVYMYREMSECATTPLLNDLATHWQRAASVLNSHDDVIGTSTGTLENDARPPGCILKIGANNLKINLPPDGVGDDCGNTWACICKCPGVCIYIRV